MLGLSVILRKVHKLNSGNNFIFVNKKYLQSDTKDTNIEEQSDTIVDKFTPVYNLKFITRIAAINRMKLYQTLLTGIVMPSSVLLNQTNLISTETAVIACTTGLSSCLMLYGLGYWCEKVIGIIYINEEENKVKLAYVDFWGRRKNEIVPIRDIVPLSELPIVMTDGLFLTFRRYTTGQTLRFILRFGSVLDQSKFNKIFAPA